MVEWKKIKDVCSNICSGGTPNTKNRDYYYGDIPWLRTQEVDWGNIYDTEIKISQKGLDNSSAKIIEKDCVIVAMYGATAAKVAINKIPFADVVPKIFPKYLSFKILEFTKVKSSNALNRFVSIDLNNSLKIVLIVFITI